MAKPKVNLPEEEIAPLQAQLYAWRSSRTSVRQPIPAEVWAGAVALARAHGLCPVSRALDLDYGALKRRLHRTDATSGLAQPAFLDLSGTAAFPPSAVATIEITEPGGARMCIHLQAGKGSEAAGIVAAFLGHRS